MEINKGSSYRGMEFLLTPLITCILTGRIDIFCVTQHQETKENDSRTLDTSKLQCCSIFRKLIQNKFSVMEYVLSHNYTLTSEVRVIEGKINESYRGFELLKVILQKVYEANPGEINLVRVRASFELPRVRVTGSQL